jgi:peptidoglycan/LPS O-acetylase OafA/YrhL
MEYKKGNPLKYDWVDAGRGIAVTLVIIVHSGIFLRGNSAALQGWTMLGNVGVQLFFILSAFTLFNSYRKRLNVDGDETNKFFFIRRFFRITPLYYAAGLFYVIVEIINSGVSGTSFFNVIVSFLYLNTVYPPAVNYIPPGGWSVGIEMLFYLTIPFMFRYLSNFSKTAVFLISALIISFVINFSISYYISHYTGSDFTQLRNSYFYYWLPNQFPVFIFGILLFHIIREKKFLKINPQLIVCAAGLIFILFRKFDFRFTFPRYFISREYFYSFIFLVFLLGFYRVNQHSLISRFFKALGKVSFSMYLVHFIVIEITDKLILGRLLNFNNDFNFLLCFPLVLSITFGISKFTYKLERKGIAWGDKIIQRMEVKPEIAPAEFLNQLTTKESEPVS